MSKDGLVKERRASLWLPTAGIAFATPFLVWFAMGDLSTSDFYEFGPYDVGPSSGYVVGGVAAVVALMAVVVLIVRTRQRVIHWSWWPVVVILALAGSVGAFGWRAATAGVGGANIGGGFAVFLGPVLIAGLLALAVWLAFISEQVSDPGRNGRGRRQALRWAWLLTVAALLVAPGLYGVENVLFQYQRTLPPRPDSSVGLITPLQYAEVRSGQTRTAVHKKLGSALPDSTKDLFPRAARGLLCDNYVDSDHTLGYQFCFRKGVLVSKTSDRAK